jgi:hypothetical protein
MKAKVFPIIFAAILLLIACKKEKTSDEIEYKITHWPVVKTLEVTNIDSTTAKLNGTVNGYGLITIVTFEYGPTTSYGSTITALQSPVTGDGITNVSAEISGLTPCTSYHYRLKAENSKWINFYSSDTTFIPGDLPTLTTTSVSGITATTAVSGGNITNAGGPIIERGVVWSPSLSSLSPIVINTSDIYFTHDDPGTGSFTSNLTELIPLTTYYVRSYALNCAGTAAWGNIISFTTGPHGPSVNTYEAEILTSTTATLKGDVNAYSFSSVVTFEYGTTTSYGLEVTAEQSPVTVDIITNVSATLIGLTCGTIYHFRVKAENFLGISYGEDLTFLAGLRPTLTTTPVTGITNTTAISGGNITDDGCSEITDRGVFISSDYLDQCDCRQPPPPTHDGSGTGSFISNLNLTGLQPSVTYYVRAYATNSSGTGWGNKIYFTTSH